MSNYLQRTLDRYTGGALSDLNNACQTRGLRGYITVAEEGNVPMFIFTGYDPNGTTRFFKKVMAPGAEPITEQVRLSEEFRALRKTKAGFEMNPASPKTQIVWN